MSFGQSGGPFGGPPRGGGGDGAAFAFGPFGGAPDGPGDGDGGSGGSHAAGGRTDRPRRPGALALTVVAVAALVGLFALFTQGYTDVLWFSQLGFQEVFWTGALTKLALFAVAGLVMAGAVWLAVHLAWRHRAGGAEDGAGRDSLSRARRQLEPVRRLAFVAGPVVLGVFAGSAAVNAWQTVLLFLHRVPYGQTDPQFGLDIMFYLATLPFLTLVVGYLMSVVLVSGIAGLAVHYLYGGVGVGESGRLHVSRAARVHVAVAAAVFLLLQAVTLWLNRYRTVQNQSPQWAGAMYTDVNAVIPTSAILAATAVLVAALFVWTAATGRWRLPLVGTAVLVLVSLVVGAAYPYVVQQYQVKPSERTREAEYIDRNIRMTREAYGLDDVQVTAYEGSTEAEAGALAGEEATTASVRLMDPNLLSQTFGQLQQFRPYYQFPSTLDVDRYEVDGQTRDTIIAARDVSVQTDQSWVNRHTVYTHGYGVVAADASQVAPGGRPRFLLSEIPSRGPLGDDAQYEPRIYFGVNSPDYSVVGAPEGARPVERDRPQTADSGDDTAYTFTGDGGPSVGSLFNRLAYAVKFGAPELLLSSDVNERSQILYNRDPVQRVQKAAPYLTVDSGAYPAIVDGRVQWIVDAYTTSDQFPYSTAEQLGEATQDSLNRTPGAALSGRVNYIRNSVKATVDAYDGSVVLYAWDETDPLLQAWQRVYPSTVRPYTEMSAELLDHVRYPEDMFKVQRELLGRYHVTDAGDFYEANDAWSVPDDPTVDDVPVAQPPYYMTMRMPGQDEASFSLTSTFIPRRTEDGQQRNVLYGFLAADGDAGTGEDGVKAEGYGTLRLLELPRSTTVPGPGQAQANFDSNATVSQELNLLRQGASEVLNGNMITLPVAGGILYVQPVYVRSSGGTTYPTLRKVLVSFGDRVGFADTFQEAVDQVFDGDAGAAAPQQGGGAEDPRPAAGSAEEELSSALAEAQDAITQGQERLADGDWQGYGEQQQRLNDALRRATEADDALRGRTGDDGGEAPASSPAPETSGEPSPAPAGESSPAPSGG